MDNGFGVYFSIKTPGGLLMAITREEWALVEQDLRAIFGEERVNKMLADLGGVENIINQVTIPDGVAALEAEGLVDETSQQMPEGNDFEKCSKCGSLKDRWVPPGVSKAGKKYSGFWGCSNRSCR